MKWLLTGLLFGFQTASAGVWEPGRTWTVDVPGDAHQARVTSIGGKPQVVVTGSFGTWVVDPSMGVAVQKSSLKGTGLWVDSEYDPKWPDLLVCGASGMTLLPTQPGGFGETTALILKPCQALGLVDVDFQEYGAPITARDEVWLWAEDAEGYIRPKTQLGSLKQPPIVVADGKEAAFAGLGADRVYFFRDNAIVKQPAGGFVGGLTRAAERWAWSLTDADVIQFEGGETLKVSETPTRLVSGDLNGDGHSAFIVAHPRALSLGVVSQVYPDERLFEIGIEAVSLALGDWNGDGCSDLVAIANERKVQLIQGQCTAEAPEVVSARTETSAPPTDMTSAEPIPTPVGTPEGTEVAPETLEVSPVENAPLNPSPTDPVVKPAPGGQTGGTALAIPVGQENTVASTKPTEPIDRGVVNVRVGGGTWPPLPVRVGETLTIQLVDSMGNATAFAGMGGPPGFVVRSDGKMSYTPKVTHVGQWRVAVRLWTNGQWGRRGGFELIVQPRAPLSAASANGSTVQTQPKPVTTSPTQSTGVGTKPTSSEKKVSRFFSGCDFGLGVAAGFTNVSENWAFIDQGIQETASPMASFSCQEGRHVGYWWFAGVDTAPLFSYFNDANRYRHTLAGTLGAGFGTHQFRAGPYVTVGFLLVGVGGRAVWYPFEQKDGTRHGFDLRASVFAQKQFAGQISLMYTIDLGDIW